MFSKNLFIIQQVKVHNFLSSLVLLVILLLASSKIAVAYQLEIKQIPASHMAQSYPATIVLPNSYQPHHQSLSGVIFTTWLWR
ncbi:hypothetical protein ALON55S_03618 [Alishewanella longhuensis]